MKALFLALTMLVVSSCSCSYSSRPAKPHAEQRAFTEYEVKHYKVLEFKLDDGTPCVMTPYNKVVSCGWGLAEAEGAE